jgi:hypothetical protein
MSIRHRSHVTGATFALLFAVSFVACGGTHAESKGPQAPVVSAPSASADRSATQPSSPQPGAPAPGVGGVAGAPHGSAAASGSSESDDEDDAELVVSRDVVVRCPKLRLVRQHVAEFDPDMVWLAVLESLGECMGQGGPMAGQSVGVSGDEEHRHVVQEVLGSRGVAPTRVIATPVAQGAAECQGGADCSKRVEITLAPASP